MVTVTLSYFGTLIHRADLLRWNGSGVAVGVSEHPFDHVYPHGAGHVMSLNLHFANMALWLAHPLLQGTLVAIMLWRKLYRTFPFFFAYIAFQIVSFAVTFPLREDRFYRLFFDFYWLTTAVSVVLGFFVIREIFLDVFRPYHTLRDLGSVLFKWAGLVMLMVAGVVAASTRGASADDLLVNAILTSQRSVRVVQCGLVLFLLVFARYLGVNWRQKSFGIALGFGGFAIVELSLVAIGRQSITRDLSGFVNMTAYNLAILSWTGYMLLKSPAREDAASMLRPQRWEQSLNDLQNPVAADSLIPMFESMVDRALSRTNEPSPLPKADTAFEESRSRRSQVVYPPRPQRVGSKS